MPSPPDSSDRENDYTRLLDVPLPDVELPSVPAVSELRSGLEGLVDETPLDPAAVEDAFADADVAPLADAEIEVSAVPEGAVDSVAAVDDGATGTVETAEETVAAAAETSGDAARVVLDGGSQAVEIVADNGGEEAAEALLEAAAAALDGL